MTLLKWRPYGDTFSWQEKIHRLFDDVISGDNQQEEDLKTCCWHPVTDIYEDKEGYVFKMEVPGVAKEDLSIEFNENNLTVKGEKKEEQEVQKDNYHRIESYCGTFCRSFTLPRNIDAQRINASLKNGILELRVPKIEEKKTKAVPITVN